MYRMFIPACLTLLVSGMACTIKENRDPCPCYLQVSFTDPGASGEAEMLGWRDDRLFRDRVRIFSEPRHIFLDNFRVLPDNAVEK